MRLLYATQGSPEWRRARLGRPTASCLDRIVTPTKLERSKSADDYLAQLTAEHFLGQPCDARDSAFMERGREFEAQARAAYEFEHGATVRQVGFVLHDSLDFGASPDGLIDAERAGIEIKVPSAKEQVKYLLDPSRLRDEYRLQCLGGLLATGLDEWFLYAWNPVFPSVRIVFGREEEYEALLAIEIAVASFCGDLARARDIFVRRGCVPFEEREAAARESAYAATAAMFEPPPVVESEPLPEIDEANLPF